MKRYPDRPMDFADATLVRLAQREGLTTVFTVDHDDFETYLTLQCRWPCLVGLLPAGAGVPASRSFQFMIALKPSV